MHLCVALALLGCSRKSSAADLIEAAHNARAVLQMVAEEHLQRHSQQLQLLAQAVKVIESLDRVAAWVTVSVSGHTVSKCGQATERKRDQLWNDGPIFAPGEIVWAFSGSDGWWPGQIRRIRQADVEVDFWNQDYQIFKQKHVKPFADYFTEYCALNGEKVDFQSDIFDALGVFATDVPGLDEVIRDVYPPRRYKQRIAVVRHFMQRWVDEYIADSRITVELMRQYAPSTPVRWITSSNSTEQMESKSKKRSSSGSTESSPKRQVTRSLHSSAELDNSTTAPTSDMPSSVDDMVQMLSALHKHQRSRRRPSEKKTVAHALKANTLQQLFDTLLEGASATEMDVLEAVRRCQVDVVELLLKTCDLALTRYEGGFTLLHEVAAINRADLVNVVIAAIDKVQIAWGGKLAVQLVDNHRRTALHIAAEAGSLDTLKALLSMGANLEARDNDGNTPLLWCTASDNATNVKTAVYLIHKGADVAATDQVGRDSLFWSINYGHVHLSKELLTHGATMGAEITEAFVKDMSLGHERFPVVLDPRPMAIVCQEILAELSCSDGGESQTTEHNDADSVCDILADGHTSSVDAAYVEQCVAPDSNDDGSLDNKCNVGPKPAQTLDVVDYPPVQIDSTRSLTDESTSEGTSAPNCSEQLQMPVLENGQMHDPTEMESTTSDFSIEQPIPQFIYARDCVAPGYLDTDPNDYDPRVERACSCAGDCLRNPTCPCIYKNGQRFPYKNGLLDFERTLIHECGKHCGCSSRCSLRKSQQGLNAPVVVCWAGPRRWGVVVKASIERGHFVCCYAGEVISPEERDEREAKKIANVEQSNSNFCTYALSYEKGSSELIIDAEVIGNVSRFFNHSCSCNLIMKPINAGGRYQRLAFFANRHIQAGEELTWNYSKGVTKRLSDRALKCCCGSASCREYL